jgi:hypothetical protein
MGNILSSRINKKERSRAYYISIVIKPLELAKTEKILKLEEAVAMAKLDGSTM